MIYISAENAPAGIFFRRTSTGWSHCTYCLIPTPQVGLFIPSIPDKPPSLYVIPITQPMPVYPIVGDDMDYLQVPVKWILSVLGTFLYITIILLNIHSISFCNVFTLQCILTVLRFAHARAPTAIPHPPRTLQDTVATLLLPSHLYTIARSAFACACIVLDTWRHHSFYPTHCLPPGHYLALPPSQPQLTDSPPHTHCVAWSLLLAHFPPSFFSLPSYSCALTLLPCY